MFMTLIAICALAAGFLFFMARKYDKTYEGDTSTIPFVGGIAVTVIAVGFIVLAPSISYFVAVGTIGTIHAESEKKEIAISQANNFSKLITEELIRKYPRFEKSLLPKLKLDGTISVAFQNYPMLKASKTITGAVEKILEYNDISYGHEIKIIEEERDLAIMKRKWLITPMK